MAARHFQPRKKNVSRLSLLISLGFHSIIVLALTYFAAREGLLGKELKKIAVEMVKEKQPEKPKEKEPDPPKPVEKPLEERAKIPEPKVAVAPPPRQEATPASRVVAPPAVAPPPVGISGFVFEGGKLVQSSSDPVAIYRSAMEQALFAKWERPQDLTDLEFVAEVEVSIDRSGNLAARNWKRRSGNARWDGSIEKTLSAVKSLSRPPPTNFPPQVTVRFDVQEEFDSFSQPNP